MLGQQTERCHAMFHSQPSRTCIVAVGMTMNALELVTADKDHQGTRYGRVPFSFSSPGFSLLVRLMAASASQQGYHPVPSPALSHIGAPGEDWHLNSFAALRPASSGRGSHLFRVAATSTASGATIPAVLKLSHLDYEVSTLPQSPLLACTPRGASSRQALDCAPILLVQADFLQLLKGKRHVIQLLARGTDVYHGRTMYAMLLPEVELLNSGHPPSLFTQVCLALRMLKSLRHGDPTSDTDVINPVWH